MTAVEMGARRCLLEPLRPPALVLDPFVRVPPCAIAKVAFQSYCTQSMTSRIMRLRELDA